MKTMIEVYARGKDADQAAKRVALHGYGQTTPEAAARMISPGERVFMVLVEAVALSRQPKKYKRETTSTIGVSRIRQRDNREKLDEVVRKYL